VPETGFPEFSFRLPRWVDEWFGELDRPYPTFEERMELVIALARENVSRRTGGPFGAGVFDLRRHTLIAPGVNVVVPANSSLLHAEIVAMILAQQVVGHFDLSAAGLPDCELVTSTEPCAMCLGAVGWSGVKRLVCGARDADARQIGFDEGAKPQDWVGQLAARGIEVVRDVCRDEASAVLRAYVAGGGELYNPRRATR
jgi:tRNA(Arg) A34 adenosine deaminase TadA